MRKFRCVPISAGIPIAFISISALQLGLTWYYWINMHDIIDVYAGIVFFSVGCFFAVVTAFPAFRRVEIFSDKVICKGLFPNQTFEIEYVNCDVGIAYHYQYGRKIWWMYFANDLYPCFKSSDRKHMNSKKIEPGFVKIVYSDEVYCALIDTLPKKQKIALETARRYANIRNQNKIIL